MTTQMNPVVEFPKTQRDLFPAAAQLLYVETYKKSRAESVVGSSDNLTQDAAAARDAWDAVHRAYKQDDVTHKWRAIGEATTVAAAKPGILGSFKNLFKKA